MDGMRGRGWGVVCGCGGGKRREMEIPALCWNEKLGGFSQE